MRTLIFCSGLIATFFSLPAQADPNIGLPLAVIRTEDPSSIDQTSAWLAASLMDVGTVSSVTHTSIQYGLTTGYGSNFSESDYPAGIGPGPYLYNGPRVTGLACGTTYHYRAVATNGNGTGYGADKLVTTLDCSTAVTTKPADHITNDSASLNSNIISLGLYHTAESGFNYGLTSYYGSNPPFVEMTTTGPYSTNLSGLKCSTLYHYRASLVGTLDRATGADTTFTTSACPIAATTSAATSIASDGAVLNGTLTLSPPSGTASVGFQYGPASGPLGPIVNAGTHSGGVFSLPVTLSCNTIYKFVATASNSSGSVIANSPMTFTTGACSSVGTSASGGVSTSTATSAVGAVKIVPATTTKSVK